MSLAKDFKEFLLKQNALALAVGVVIGVAVGKVVSAIVEDIIMPIVGHPPPRRRVEGVVRSPQPRRDRGR